MNNLQKIINDLESATTQAELELSTIAVNAYFLICPEAEKEKLQKAIAHKVAAIALSADKAITEAKTYLNVNGSEYPLSDWVTLKEYCNRYHLKSTSVVSNWIARGVVPSENIIVVPEMNNLKLIRAVPYLV